MILTILFGVVGFGIMVFVHELGHFLAAKRLGIQVEIFSLGWGKKLVGVAYKGTEYRISLIPFGGYCKMKGEDPFRLSHSREEGSFFAAPAWKRILVAASGPTANLLFAIVVLTAIWWIGFKMYSDDTRIVLASDYALDSFAQVPPATKAGLKTGDRILAIDGQAVQSFQEILETVSTAPNRPLELRVERGGTRLMIQVEPELDLQTGAGKIGVYAWRDPVVDRVQPGSAAEVAGLSGGDSLLSANGTPIRHSIDLFQLIEKKPGKLEMRLQRGAEQISRTLVVHYTDQGLPELGFSFKMNVYHSPRVGPAGAMAKGLRETWNTLSLTVKGIGLLFRGVSFRNAVAGPLRITYYVGTVATSGFAQSVSQGLVSYFRFLCLLSIVLFLMNLLPIPALDGGQVLVFLLEIVRRKPVSPKVISRIQVISFSFLILLAVLITFSDILFFMGK